MIWCWVQAILLCLAIFLGVLLPVAAVLLLIVGGIAACEAASPHIPQLIKHGGKYVFGSLAVLFIVLSIGAVIFKAQQKVCAVGFKAAWSSAWK